MYAFEGTSGEISLRVVSGALDAPDRAVCVVALWIVAHLGYAHRRLYLPIIAPCSPPSEVIIMSGNDGEGSGGVDGGSSS